MGNSHGLVRIAALSGYQRVADRLGLDTRPLLKAAGLTPTILSQPVRRSKRVRVPRPPESCLSHIDQCLS